MTIDEDRLKNDSEYNQAFMEDFYMNRDDRFYTSIYLEVYLILVNNLKVILPRRQLCGMLGNGMERKIGMT